MWPRSGQAEAQERPSLSSRCSGDLLSDSEPPFSFSISSFLYMGPKSKLHLPSWPIYSIIYLLDVYYTLYTILYYTIHCIALILWLCAAAVSMTLPTGRSNTGPKIVQIYVLHCPSCPACRVLSSDGWNWKRDNNIYSSWIKLTLWVKCLFGILKLVKNA